MTVKDDWSPYQDDMPFGIYRRGNTVFEFVPGLGEVVLYLLDDDDDQQALPKAA